MTPRNAWLLVLGAFCLAAAACGTSTAGAPTTSPTVGGASQSPASASPAPVLRRGNLEVLPLDDLSSGAADMARQLGNPVGIAVYVPSEERIYQYNAEPEFRTASVVKLPIMLAVMDRAVQESRAITEEESALIRAMITESDNDAASALWIDIGGAEAVQGYLESIGIRGTSMYDENWGESTMSAVAGALLMGKLVDGEVLDAPHREYAMELLTQVDPSQDWGAVGAGRHQGQAGVKNGWYPEYEGWVLGSVGYVVPEGDAPVFTIAIFTDEWLYFSQGVYAIESIASLINTAVLSE